MHHIHTHAPYAHTCTTKYVQITTCTYMHHMHAQLKVHICAPYTHACTTKYTCHTQTPPKHKIYIVGLPLYSMKHQIKNKRSVLNQLFLLLFSVLFHFSGAFCENRMLFTKTTTVFMKTATFHEICNSFHMKFCELLGYHQV